MLQAEHHPTAPPVVSEGTAPPRHSLLFPTHPEHLGLVANRSLLGRRKGEGGHRAPLAPPRQQLRVLKEATALVAPAGLWHQLCTLPGQPEGGASLLHLAGQAPPDRPWGPLGSLTEVSTPRSGEGPGLFV